MKNLFKLFENVDEMLEEGYEWTEEEVRKALKNKDSAEDLANYLDRLTIVRDTAEVLIDEDNAANYLEDAGYGYVYNMTELNDVLNGNSPYDIAQMIYYGDFNVTDAYFTIDDLGHLASADCKSELIEEIEEIRETALNIFNIADELIRKEFKNLNDTYGTNLMETCEIRAMFEHFENVERVENLKNEVGELLFV